MTKQELIDRVADSNKLPPELTKKMVGLVVDAVFAELRQYFVKSKLSRRVTPRFAFPGFGTFTKKQKSARRGINPRTGQPIVIPEAITVAFQPGIELKSLLNRFRPLAQARG